MRPLILAAALLAGCATVNAGPFAGAGWERTWLNRATGEMRHCVQGQQGITGSLVMGVAAGDAYAACKRQLEADGFERMP